jgi:hypothetical protein
MARKRKDPRQVPPDASIDDGRDLATPRPLAGVGMIPHTPGDHFHIPPRDRGEDDPGDRPDARPDKAAKPPAPPAPSAGSGKSVDDGEI